MHSLIPRLSSRANKNQSDGKLDRVWIAMVNNNEYFTMFHPFFTQECANYKKGNALQQSWSSAFTVLTCRLVRNWEQNSWDGELLELPWCMAEEEEEWQMGQTPPLFAGVATAA